MGDREVDQQLVERAQRGDKRAFELLVMKYQRKLGRLLSRLVRDPAEVEDVTQEAFIKAYRALPSFRGDSAFYTWLYRIAINTAKNYLVAMGRRAPTTTGFDHEEAESFEDAEQLRDSATPEGELHRQADRRDGEPRDGCAARGSAHGDHAARDRRVELRGNRERDELPDRHRALADLPRARGDRRRAAAAARHRREPEMVMNENISRLMDGELDDAEFERVCGDAEEPTTRMATWACYHMIGDALRGARALSTARRRARSRSALAAEPTVLAPQRARADAAATWAWAAAATAGRGDRRRLDRVLGLDATPGRRSRKAREATRDTVARAAAPSDGAGRLPARAPGILAGDGDPGRRSVPARGRCAGRTAVGRRAARASWLISRCHAVYACSAPPARFAGWRSRRLSLLVADRDSPRPARRTQRSG